MRILVGADVPCDPNSGAAGTVYQTNRALRELGHDVDEIWADDLGRRIRHGNLHYLLELPRAYRREVREKCAATDYDVIQLSQPYAWLAAKDHQCARRRGVFVNRSHGVEPRIDEIISVWRKRLNVPATRFPRSLVSGILHRMVAGHWLAVAEASDGIIVGCEVDRDYVVSRMGIDPEKVRTIQHGAHQTYVTSEAKPMTEDRLRRVLHVSQYSFFKGPHVLGPVVSRLLEARHDLTFTWVCSKQHHKQARALIQPSVLARVELLDWMSQAKLMSVYDRHGVFLFTSLAEGAAKASLEAMARGLCVVATDGSGMKDYIVHERSGKLVPIGDKKGFIVAVSSLLDHAEACREMSAEARSTAIEYTWRRCAEKATEFYRDLIDQKEAARTSRCGK